MAPLKPSKPRHFLRTTSLFFATAVFTMGAAMVGQNPSSNGQSAPRQTQSGHGQAGASNTGAAGGGSHPGSSEPQQKTDQSGSEPTWQNGKAGKNAVTQHSSKRAKKGAKKQNRPQSQAGHQPQ